MFIANIRCLFGIPFIFRVYSSLFFFVQRNFVTFAIQWKNLEKFMDELMKEDIRKACEVMQRGGVILYPTDTIWGIGCDATNAEAVKRVYEIKKRADSKAMLVLVDNAVKVDFYVNEPPEVAFDLIECATKPMTIIYDDARNLAPNLLAEDGSVGIRITQEPFTKALCEQLHRPIVSTSANFSGEPAAKIFSDICPELLEAVDYVCEFRRDDTTSHQPSAIVKIDEKERITIIRS